MNQFDQYRQIQTFKTSELLVEAPSEIVWPFLLDFASINDTFERVELLSGVQNTVGAISRLTKRKGKWWMPPYLVKIIHLDPSKQIVWKMFPEEGEEFSRFVDFSLSKIERKTLFTIRLYMEQRLTVRSSEEETTAAQLMIETSGRLHREVLLPNLKRLAEQAAKEANIPSE